MLCSAMRSAPPSYLAIAEFCADVTPDVRTSAVAAYNRECFVIGFLCPLPVRNAALAPSGSPAAR